MVLDYDIVVTVNFSCYIANDLFAPEGSFFCFLLDFLITDLELKIIWLFVTVYCSDLAICVLFWN